MLSLYLSQHQTGERILFLFLSSVPAFALQPTAPELRIPVGNEATVRTLPKVSYKMNELIIRGCDRNLSDMLDGLHSKSIRSLFAFNVGESTWLVRLVLKDEKAHIANKEKLLTEAGGIVLAFECMSPK